jgi:hypothetical protein
VTDLADVFRIYQGSDGAATKALFVASPLAREVAA